MLTRAGFQEKRDFIRMGVECPATFTVIGENAPPRTAMTLDLSATGARIQCSEAIAIGTELHLSLRPERTVFAPLDARATVVRCDSEGAGFILGLNILEILPV